jgi:hypothetical protein
LGQLNLDIGRFVAFLKRHENLRSVRLECMVYFCAAPPEVKQLQGDLRVLTDVERSRRRAPPLNDAVGRECVIFVE